MHYITIVENKEEGYKTKVSVWGTINNQVWLEMGPEDNDPMMMQGMVLDLEDAKVLANELVRIIREIEE